MTTSADNLSAVLRHFGVSNKQLASSLGVDPSLVSRWISGQRKLRASGAQMDALAGFILAQVRRRSDMEWLCAQFEAAGLPPDESSSQQTKQNLILWLASDGTLLRGLGAGDGASGRARYTGVNADGAVRSGFAEIAMALEPYLDALPLGARLDMFLSGDEVSTPVSGEVSKFLIHAIEKKQLEVRILVVASANTQGMSQLIDAYMQPLISGRVEVSVARGMSKAVTKQMQLILPGRCVALIAETFGSYARPVATMVSDPQFIREASAGFESALHYAQPVLTIYDDDFSRNILEILYGEFCTPGNLDVVKDSVNPLAMSPEAYDRFLGTRNHPPTEYLWRSAEFVRFRSGMAKTIRSGSCFREILSLKRLGRIAEDGFCQMPGLYFIERGAVQLDARGCADVLSGYIRMIEEIQGFRVLIVNDLPMLNAGTCWHIKQGQSVGINHWRRQEPVMIYSDQPILIREFQEHFDAMWTRGSGSPAHRSGAAAILRDVRRRLIERFPAAGR